MVAVKAKSKERREPPKPERVAYTWIYQDGKLWESTIVVAHSGKELDAWLRDVSSEGCRGFTIASYWEE